MTATRSSSTTNVRCAAEYPSARTALLFVVRAAKRQPRCIATAIPPRDHSTMASVDDERFMDEVYVKGCSQAHKDYRGAGRGHSGGGPGSDRMGEHVRCPRSLCI